MIIFIRELVKKSRWLLLPFYLGLILAQVMYSLHYARIIFESLPHFWYYTESEMMLFVLALVDMTMIANLIKTIISGSYHTFIDKGGNVSDHISSGYLKVKMGMSLIGVSSIHLLQSFIDSAHTSDRDLIVKASIHVLFLVGTMGLAVIEYLHEKSLTLDKLGCSHPVVLDKND